MKADYFHRKFEKIIQASPGKYRQEFQENLWPSLLNSSVRYQGRPVKFVYTPYLITLAQWKFYRRFISLFVNILNKTIDEFLHNKAFRNKFPFGDKMEKYILMNPGYKGNFPIARFDILFDRNDNIKFCELNTDGTSAMNEVRVMQKILAQSDAAISLRNNENISFYGFELFNSWINILLDKYREFSGKKRVNPTIAIIDFLTEGVVSEFKEFRDHMQAWDLEAYVVDPRELSYNGEKLKYKDKKVDLIYRRATTARLFDNFEEITDLLTAYKDRKVCMCGGFRSQIIHNKAIFHVLNSDDLDFLTPEEKSFLDKYLLRTGMLKDEDEIKKELINNQEEYILKPCDKFAGKGIKLGKNCDTDEWEQNLDNCCNNNYLYQHFCQPATVDLFTIPEKDKEKASFEPYHYTLGFYLYDEKLKGLYNRAGRYDIIGSDYECVTVPSYVTVSDNTSVQDLKEEVKYE